MNWLLRGSVVTIVESVYRVIHRFRFVLSPAAILLLAVAFFHCAWEWQAELNHRHALAAYREAGLPPPIGFPDPGCDNESGCICRGATVATPLDAGALNAADALWQWLELPPVAQFYFSEALAKSLPPIECIAPPLSGRQLRALYASFVI
jgi:hypothetical protein